MNRFQNMEVNVVHDVIISYPKEEEERVDDW